MQFSLKAKAGLAALAVVAAVGVGAWVYQQFVGLGATGMSNITSWGLYIALFMFFVGLSAGGLIVASSASVFKIEKFERVAIPAVICSMVCICLAGMFILIDLGGIARVWRLLTSPNFTSPLMWDVCVITLYLTINVLDLVFLVKGNHRAVAVLSRIALPTAILVHSVTAWIFGLQIARTWYTAIMAPIFVASACDSGLALLLVSLALLEHFGIFTTGKKLFKSLAGLLAVFIAVDAFFIGCELLTMAYPGGEHAQALQHMLVGATSPFFWFEVIVGLAVPFALLVFDANRGRRGMVVTASLLVIAGVLAKRIWLLFTAFIDPNVAGAPGVTLGTARAAANGGSDMWALVGTYAPTLPELAIVAGVLAVGLIAYVVLAKLFVPQAQTPLAQDDAETLPSAGSAAAPTPAV
ncbi:polysulfide reductase NrfD [Eggerthellaceae bacterium zg-1084]|uniref:Polysulfide reductase NrfD n=1 Tax=Berryella wangjianweii TaxID=2734634 RepID=A0A6M8J1S0_9ACTN|nr:NrfD/PsrC family molybdoenzyme membrane anchor subunit [Berryella wangjianweii]NPD31015.1 polysulfide reductase NrfD [Berryella wangjianweii]NPD31877.1 polysulfide reductase NrfD [Eggerthellaceae bacterium zg-997]QKF07527.1 polysulfide reductase NrfD [Berryella wangjianweii]